jgi:hypothetical protein
VAAASIERGRAPSVLLDIGQDIGALLVYTSPELRGREIEVNPTGNAARRTHTEVLERTANGRSIWAAVFAALPAGDYSLWRDVLTDETVTIGGGSVTEVDWRAITDATAFRLARPEGWASDRSPDASDASMLREVLPPRYRQGQTVSAAPMGSAPLRYAADGAVAWEHMWTDLVICAQPLEKVKVPTRSGSYP